MGWSVGSAVTAAMLMGATRRVVTAAATLAGQVSDAEKIKRFGLPMKRTVDFRFCGNINAFMADIFFICVHIVHLSTHYVLMQTVPLYFCLQKRLSTDYLIFFNSRSSFCTPVPRGASCTYTNICLKLASCRLQHLLTAQGWTSVNVRGKMTVIFLSFTSECQTLGTS